jgi:hypothetical protein
VNHPASKRAARWMAGVTSRAAIAHQPVQSGSGNARPRYRGTASGEECNILSLHVVLYQGLHPVAPHSAEIECDAWNETQKAAAGKRPKRAGAPPLFRLAAPQRVHGVAPALFNKTRQLHCRVHRRKCRTVVRRAWRRGSSRTGRPQGEIIFVAQRHKFLCQR